ncbi:hypothetical protein GGX14DRAFT_574871 [Mycena pura]|uniref:Uncharacterized protein n=1 Tax=Mycena pura TaxID=153505 RepID=A0AAD6V096_9AGAR|nr:hypothetical protein GGX14DRAFT_574871 [Mycena pura]
MLHATATHYPLPATCYRYRYLRFHRAATRYCYRYSRWRRITTCYCYTLLVLAPLPATTRVPTPRHFPLLLHVHRHRTATCYCYMRANTTPRVGHGRTAALLPPICTRVIAAALPTDCVLAIINHAKACRYVSRHFPCLADR